MLRANPRVLGAALFSALGLAPLACGGTLSKGDGRRDSGSAFRCEDPQPWGAGYERCGNGTLHRTSVETCANGLPRAVLPDLPPGDCTTDADCTELPNGYCSVSDGDSVVAYCAYGCVTDADCGAGSICVCGDYIGVCAQAKCTSDEACGNGLRCQSYDVSRGCNSLGFACQTPNDECGGDVDCPQDLCGAGDAGPFVCQNTSCAVGRPFLVDGLARAANVVGRSDWLLPLDLELGAASLSEREAAGVAWCRIGQMEHASVAAFARFALQLLSLGAPPSLVEAATSAMADETRHAQLAFGVASSLLGRAVGPAVLDVEQSLLETSLVDIARLVIREGCIGETCAALEAREAALHAAQPELAQLLQRVADDESRHAELAWRFVSYALERDPQRIGALLQDELLEERSLVESAHLPATSAHELAAAALGILPERLRGELRAVALRQVVAPCAMALLRQRAGAVAENQVLSA